MSDVKRWSRPLAAAVVAVSLAAVPLTAHSLGIPDYPFATPVFGLTTGWDGSLLVADAGAGIVRLGHKGGELLTALPGVTDVAPIGPHTMWAVTGGGTAPTSAKLYKVSNGIATEFADLGHFEATVNPDGLEINPNPFDVAALPGGAALVADAGANALLIVDKSGTIDWVATLPRELVPTDNAKKLVNCPAGPANICGLPPEILAQAVTPSVAIGPDGAFYMGELKGFPAPTGRSRIWRINRHARHAQCGTSPDCEVVADGFTSIIDLAFGWDGTLHVVELDEASWFSVEVTHTPIGGTVNACRRHPWGGAFKCVVEATKLPMPIAATVGFFGKVYVAINSLVPGSADVVALP